MWLSRLSVAVCLVLAPGGRRALAAPPTATDVALRASTCRSASAGTQPGNFELRGVRVGDIDLSVRLDGGFVTVTANDQLRLARFGETIVIPR